MNNQWFYAFFANSVISLLAIPIVSVIQAPLLSVATWIVTRVWLPVRYSWWVLVRTNASCFAGILAILLLVDMLVLEGEISPSFPGAWLEFALRWQAIAVITLIQFVHFVAMRQWIQYPARGLEELSWLQTVFVLLLYALGLVLALASISAAAGHSSGEKPVRRHSISVELQTLSELRQSDRRIAHQQVRDAR